MIGNLARIPHEPARTRLIPLTPEAPSLKSRALRGSIWTLGGHAARNSLRLGGNLVLAYLLSPDAFGMMALIQVFINGLNMFSDLGIGHMIIRSDRGENPAFLNTAWTVQVLRGAVIWVAIASSASIYADFYDQPLLTSYLPVAGLTVIITGFRSTRMFTASRSLALGRKTVLEVAARAVGVATMVSWAYFVERSVWALIIGSLVSSFTALVLSHTILPGERNRFQWDREAGRELIHFGKWIFLGTIFTFLALQVDKLILGKLSTVAELGIYSIAMNLTMMPHSVLTSLSGSVVYPVLAQIHRQRPDDFSAQLTIVRRTQMTVGMIGVIGVTLLAQPFFDLFYPVEYRAAGHIARFAALPLWFLIINLGADHAALTLGDTRARAFSNVAAVIFRVAGSIAAYEHFGIPGFIVGLALGDLARQVVIQLALRSRGIHLVAQDVGYTVATASIVALGISIPIGLHAVTPVRLDVAQALVAAALLTPLAVSGVRQVRHARAGKRERPTR